MVQIAVLLIQHCTVPKVQDEWLKAKFAVERTLVGIASLRYTVEFLCLVVRAEATNFREHLL